MRFYQFHHDDGARKKIHGFIPGFIDKNAGWPKKSLALLQPLAFYLMGHFIFDVSQKTRTRVP